MKSAVISSFIAAMGVSILLYQLKPLPASNHAGMEPGREPPQRIILLSPALVEIAFHAGLGNKVIAAPDFTVWPKEALRLPRIGARFNPNLEKILALKPDLVVFQGRNPVIKAFAVKHGIPFYGPGIKLDTVEDIFNAYSILGRLARSPVEAEKAGAGLRLELARLMERSYRRKSVPRALLVLGKNRSSFKGIYTATSMTFIGELVEMVGAINVFGNSPGLWPKISLEGIIGKNPDAVLILSPGKRISPVEEVREWEKSLPSVEAVKRRKIFIIDEPFVLIPGPRILDTARLFERVLFEDA